MRTHSVIALLLFVFVFVMADVNNFYSYAKQQASLRDTLRVGDSMQSHRTDTAKTQRTNNTKDTLTLDSLQLAIQKHNQIIDDSIRLDSLNRRKSKGIDAPVEYTADDSLIYDAKTKTCLLYTSPSPRDS